MRLLNRLCDLALLMGVIRLIIDNRWYDEAFVKQFTDLPLLVHTHPEETVRTAIDIMREYGVSQLPVVKAEPPVVLGEVVGEVYSPFNTPQYESVLRDIRDSVEAFVKEASTVLSASDTRRAQELTRQGIKTAGEVYRRDVAAAALAAGRIGSTPRRLSTPECGEF